MKRTLAACAILLCLTAALAAAARQAPPASTDNLVLVTLDGARTEEIFGGLDTAVLQSTLKEGQRLEDSPTYARFGAATREERRRKLMPFFWDLVSTQGSIAGDRQSGSIVRLGNRQWFSYPGYAEILLGQAYDTEITSNDPIRNPHTTVLETLRERLRLPREKVATFGSWGVFNAIAEHVEGATLVNAGPEPLESSDPEVTILNELQTQARTPWDGIRHDAFTFRLAMRHLALARPRVLYIAFDETDDWAHDGRYDRVLDAYARIDEELRQLWTWLQEQPDYKGRTHLLITTDHGRGHTPAGWRNHGAKTEGSEDVWIAFVSPRMARRGVWTSGTLSTSQIAATMASWMGIDWNADHPAAGRPIE